MTSFASRPTRGAWIETVIVALWNFVHGRAPHGARGLKLSSILTGSRKYRRAPHGARGLKLFAFHSSTASSTRAPHGARGLKLNPDH